MSKTEPNENWETVQVVSIPPGMEVMKKSEGEEKIVLPAIAILHQTLFSSDSVTERIVLAILNVNTGEIMSAEPGEVLGVDAPWFDGEDEEEVALDWHGGDEEDRAHG